MEWREIPGLENYEVSEYGHVRRVKPACGATVGHILTPKKHVFGYPRYDLRQNGKNIGIEAHRAVALAFLGPRPFPKAEVAHLDGYVYNNHYSNLIWCSHKTNESHKIDHGTSPKGEKNGSVKLNADKVREIRYKYRGGQYSYFKLAKEYDVAFQTIGKIINYQTWAHIDPFS